MGSIFGKLTVYQTSRKMNFWALLRRGESQGYKIYPNSPHFIILKIKSMQRSDKSEANLIDIIRANLDKYWTKCLDTNGLTFSIMINLLYDTKGEWGEFCPKVGLLIWAQKPKTKTSPNGDKYYWILLANKHIPSYYRKECLHTIWRKSVIYYDLKSVCINIGTIGFVPDPLREFK